MNYSQAIHELVRRLQPKKGLEIGFGFEGHSAKAYLGACKGTLVSIDKKDWTGNAGKLAESNPRFMFVTGWSGELLPQTKHKFDYIYVDGDHTYEGAYDDIKKSIPLLLPGGTIVLDDYGVEWGNTTTGENGELINGTYGVRQAADALLTGWERIHPDIELGNGGRAYRKPE